MIKKLFVLLFIIPFCIITHAQIVPVSNWWDNEPYRLVQTNLREIDARDFDIEVYVESVKDLGANTVLINVGGIVANYYTGLDFHYQNPNLKINLIEEVIKRLHEEGIRVIGRFDFSKINEELAAKKPEWLYKSIKGETVNYNKQVHTCLNAGYQQEYLFRILEEALTMFPLDGVFFNMIGYKTRDYGHNYHGICQSEACRERFKEWSGGLDLPVKEDFNDPLFRKYTLFKKETSDELFYRIQDKIRSFGDHIAICTYTYAGTDFYRTEANSHQAFYNDFVPWEYQASQNVKVVLGSWKGKLVSNAAVHFFGFPARHAADSRWLTQQRLFQNIMNGAGTDFYCIGRLDNLEDRLMLENVKDVFQFHKAHEEYFLNIHSGNRVLLLDDYHSGNEYKGIFEMLSENQVLFDVMNNWCLGNEDMPRELSSYELVIMPDVRRLSDAQCALIDEYVKNGGKLFCTGLPSVSDEHGNPLSGIRLNSLGVYPEYQKFAKEQGTYYRIFNKDKEALRDTVFQYLDLVYAWEEGIHCKLREGAKGLLGYIPPAMVGPPEKCYYTEVTDIPGLVVNKHGEGKTAMLTFKIGAMYHHTRQYGHEALFMSTLENLLGYQKDINTQAGPMLEVSRQISNNKDFEWVGLLNHSGQLGNGFNKPVPLKDVKIQLIPQKKVKSLKSLGKNQKINFTPIGNKDAIELYIPSLEEYDVLLIEYQDQ